MATIRQLVERILRRLEGDTVAPIDSRYTERYILGFVQEAIAYHAKKSALESNNLEGILYANDAFNITYKNLSVKTDTSGQKYIELPALPVGLPKNRSLVRLTPTGSYKNNLFKPIAAKDISKYFNLQAPSSISFYYIENGSLRFISCGKAFPLAMDLVMVTSGGGLDDQLNLPPDAQAEVVTYVLNVLWREKPQDVVNDGTSIDSNGAL